MRFDEALSILSSEVTKTNADSETETKLKNCLNFAKIAVGKAALWRQLQCEGAEIIAVPDYTVGTAVITKDSRVVTLIGGVVSTSFKGRFFKSYSMSYEYEIVNVDVNSNTLTLKSPVVENSETATYYIRKVFYRVNSDILTVLPDLSRQDRPSHIDIIGYDEYAQDYNASNISVTQDSNVLTGVGTSFLDNVYPGDIIEVQSKSYRVKKVNSDTEIEMRNRAEESLTGSCVIRSDSPYKAKLSSNIAINRDSKSLVRYSYIRILYKMVSDRDDTELPVIFDRCILDFAKAEFGRIVKDPDYTKDLQIAQLRLDGLKLNREIVLHAYDSFSSYVPKGFGRR